MIVVWNYNRGDHYGFADLKAYEAFARETEGDDRTCLEDQVYDVGTGGKATDELDLHTLKCDIADNAAKRGANTETSERGL